MRFFFCCWDSWVSSTQYASIEERWPQSNLLSAGRLCKRESSGGARVQLERADFFKTWIYWYVQCLEENKGSNRNAEGNSVGGSGSLRCSHRGGRCDRLLGESNKPEQKFKSISCQIFPPRSTVLPRPSTSRLHGRHHLHLWPGHTPRLHRLANHPVHVKDGVNIRSALRFHLSFVYDDNREKKYW